MAIDRPSCLNLTYFLQGGELRDRDEMYRGVGAPGSYNDPFEAFRKNKAGTFYTRIRERDKDRHTSKK